MREDGTFRDTLNLAHEASSLIETQLQAVVSRLAEENKIEAELSKQFCDFYKSEKTIIEGSQLILYGVLGVVYGCELIVQRESSALSEEEKT